MTPQRLVEIADLHRRALLEDVVPFWLRHSLDREHGGYVTYLDRQGGWYGTDKPIWLQGREAWLFATLYADVERRDEWLEAARSGVDFLTRHAFDPRGKMYFLVTREGRPLRMRRYVYSEVFAIMALAALYRATGDELLRRRAIHLFKSFLTYLRVPGMIPPKIDPYTRPTKGLAPLMCLVSLCETLLRIDPAGPYEPLIDETIEEIFRDFVKWDRRCVLESVGPGGEVLEGPDGRVMNPGHAIECAWFILEVARRRGDRALVEQCCALIDIAFERGWDAEHGGLLYFVDVDGRPPVQLEHDMKLWWPHNEALIAALMAFVATRQARYANMYEQLHAWTWRHFPDPEFGEWYGYLRRDGAVSTPLKGGPWKGAFHVPRCLLQCWKLAEQAGAA